MERYQTKQHHRSSAFCAVLPLPISQVLYPVRTYSIHACAHYPAPLILPRTHPPYSYSISYCGSHSSIVLRKMPSPKSEGFHYVGSWAPRRLSPLLPSPTYPTFPCVFSYPDQVTNQANKLESPPPEQIKPSTSIIPNFNPNKHLIVQQSRALLVRFRLAVLNRQIAILDISSQFTSQEVKQLHSHIAHYFDHITARLDNAAVTFPNLIDCKEYQFDDFLASYGHRFVEYARVHQLGGSQLDQLVHRYTMWHPEDILQLRMHLFDISVDYFIDSHKSCDETDEANSMKALVKLEMITYKVIDPIQLHAHLQRNFTHQIEDFIERVQLTSNGRQNLQSFIKLLIKMLTKKSCPLAVLRPRIHQFGSLANGLGAYDSDLDLVIMFDAFPEADLLDYETAILALEVVENVLRDIGLSEGVRVVRSRRCPIVQLDFELCFPELTLQTHPEVTFNKCDISVSCLYGVHNSALLRALTHHQPRFYQMSLLLKYWAKQNNLIHTEAFSSYAFTLLIVYYLQICHVFPPIARLQCLAKIHGVEQIRIHQYTFDFHYDPSELTNCDDKNSVQYLIVGFFRFYCAFDYDKHVISPRVGEHPVHKPCLYNQKAQEGLPFAESIICIEDPFVLDHNVGSICKRTYFEQWTAALYRMLHQYVSTLAPYNVVLALTDPDYFLPDSNNSRRSSIHRRTRHSTASSIDSGVKLEFNCTEDCTNDSNEDSNEIKSIKH